MWKAVETKAGEIRVAKIERRRGKRGCRKETRRKEKEEGENDRYKKGSRGIGNLG